MKNRLKEVLAIQSESYGQERMYAYIEKRLKALGIDYYDDNGNIYATKGQATTYPCIVSHMDTVHDIVSDLTVVEVEGKLTGINKDTMKQTGIGGDDKVGIYIALECLEHFPYMKSVFFRDEEVGCQGSYNPDKLYFDNVGFTLQCDRKGYGDFITSAGGTKLSSKDFQHDIKPILDRYKYNFTSGMMTDVMALKESGIKCAMANMSCGYYNPHCKDEYVSIAAVKWVLDMVKEIFAIHGHKAYTCTPPKVKAYYPSYAKSFNKGDWKDEWEKDANGQWRKKVVTAKPASYRKDWDDWEGRDDWEQKWKDDEKNSESLDAWDDAKWKTKFGNDDIAGDVGECDGCLETAPLSWSHEWNCDICDKCRGDHNLSGR